MKSLTEQLACCRRELALRRNTYPKWVAQSRMTQDAASHEIGCMEAVVTTLEKLQMLAEVSEEIKGKA
jgi:hypothetical protein